ncbi:MAG: YceI family protein [Myxococcales bacterium]|nr:YceI family protein [Myxococcales bacterium]
MALYDASTAECQILTFKEGLLSRVAHDLKFELRRFRLQVEDETRAIEAEFELESIELVCARKDGRDDPGALDASDAKKILSNLRSEVLHTRRFPKARFTSTRIEPVGEGAIRVEGTLELHGRERTIRGRALEQEGRWILQLELHQPDYGIKPFSAMMGALKVKPGVQVRISIPA